jgi:hypothetical protein
MNTFEAKKNYWDRAYTNTNEWLKGHTIFFLKCMRNFHFYSDKLAYRYIRIGKRLRKSFLHEKYIQKQTKNKGE